MVHWPAFQLNLVPTARSLSMKVALTSGFQSGQRSMATMIFQMASGGGLDLNLMRGYYRGEFIYIHFRISPGSLITS